MNRHYDNTSNGAIYNDFTFNDTILTGQNNDVTYNWFYFNSKSKTYVML